MAAPPDETSSSGARAAGDAGRGPEDPSPPMDRRGFLRGVGVLGAAAAGIHPLEPWDPSLRYALAGLASRPRQEGTTYAIHPAMGVARLGNAPAEPSDPSSWYLAAEAPYQVPNEGRPYKVGGRLKKQAQRFRIYEYRDGVAVREITLGQEDVAAIRWTVHVSNRKAALDPAGAPGSVSVPGVMPDRFTPAGIRNDVVQDRTRAALAIDPGPQSVSDPGTTREMTGEISFPLSEQGGSGGISRSVSLGRIHSEAGSGRLLVFAADGISEGVTQDAFSPAAPIKERQNDWVNNDLWYDDTADGRIQAEITFRDPATGRESTVVLDRPEQTAWVICAAPRYAPGFNQFTSIYDVAMDAGRPAGAEPPRPSFARDIYPILRSAAQLTWVSARASLGHSAGRGGYYLSEDVMRVMMDNDAAANSDAYIARQGVLRRIRNPGNYQINQIGAYDMPRLPTEVIREPEHEEWDIAAVTPLQYRLLERWADGDFDADGIPGFVPLEEIPVRDQPGALDRAALEATCGTPFYPGIESWRILRTPDLYAGVPLRLNAAVKPGDLTLGNALPWQADFLDCTDAWWPIQRPTEVSRGMEPAQPWVPASWGEHADEPKYTEMIQHWWRLGFVVSLDGGATYQEVERDSEGLGG